MNHEFETCPARCRAVGATTVTLRPDAEISLAALASPLPRVWMAAQVQDSEHCNQVHIGREEYSVWKITNQRAPDFLLDDRKLRWILQEPGENRIDRRLKAEAEALTLAFVPKRRLEDLELRFGGDVEPPHSADGAETGQQLLADLRPRARGHLAAAVCREPVGNDLAMPLRHRNFFRMLGEMVPQRLNVFELLIRRELVKPRRWKSRLRHEPSIPSSGAPADPLHATTANYVSVNAIKRGWRSRTRDAIGAIRHVFLEADEDSAGVLARVAARSDLPEPSYLLHSSPDRVHIFWRAIGFGPEQVEALQKHLARELGTDLSFHQRLGEYPNAFPKDIPILLLEELANKRRQIHSGLAIVAAPPCRPSPARENSRNESYRDLRRPNSVNQATAAC